MICLDEYKRNLWFGFWGGGFVGCSTIYYKKALHRFAYYLNCNTDIKLAKQLSEESDIDKLEKHIKEKKESIFTGQFFYNAGMACMDVLKYANENDGCDGLNACIGGLSMFEDFIELTDDEN